jgi:hypothetical protein
MSTAGFVKYQTRMTQAVWSSPAGLEHAFTIAEMNLLKDGYEERHPGWTWVVRPSDSAPFDDVIVTVGTIATRKQVSLC